MTGFLKVPSGDQVEEILQEPATITAYAEFLTVRSIEIVTQLH